MNKTLLALLPVVAAHFASAADEVPAACRTLKIVTSEGSDHTRARTASRRRLTVGHFLEASRLRFLRRYDLSPRHPGIHGARLVAIHPDLKLKEDRRRPFRMNPATVMSNARGTIAMARTGRPALSQLAVLHQCRRQFETRSGQETWSVATGAIPFLASVIEGMEVVDKIVAMCKTGPQGDHFDQRRSGCADHYQRKMTRYNFE